MIRIQRKARERLSVSPDHLRKLADLLGLPIAVFGAGYLYGPGAAGLFALFAIPFLLIRHRSLQGQDFFPLRTAGEGLTPREQIVMRLNDGYRSAGGKGLNFGCLAIGIDGGPQLIARFGHAQHARLLRRAADRIGSVLRESDLLRRMEDGHFAVAVAPVRRITSDSMAELAQRIRTALAEPFDIEGVTIRLGSTVGHCLAGRCPSPDGESLLCAAELALHATRNFGAEGIRAFSPEIARSNAQHDELVASAAAALEQGEIVAYFQPQVSTHTGDVTGFEALARWLHPSRGLLSPARFLPALQDAGLSARLGEVMLSQALSALRSWDRAGLRVPHVSVNFSTDELMDPSLADHVAWELDRFDLRPHRLNIEILETVVSDAPGGQIERNIAALSRLGCGIDLDDFGTGNASISAIRRFAVNRIKIDRSLVTNVDSDPGQRRIVSAVLSMAAPLDLGIVAEGVETPAEHAILAQLGCDHVQGYTIARPMPLDDALTWIRAHRRNLTPAEIPGRRAT